MKTFTLLIVGLFITTGSLFAQLKADKKDTLQHQVVITQNIQPGKKGIHLYGKEKVKAEVVGIQNYPMVIVGASTRRRFLTPKEEMKAEVMKLYTCPVHRLTALDKNGICTKCSKNKAIKELESRLKI